MGLLRQIHLAGAFGFGFSFLFHLETGSDYVVLAIVELNYVDLKFMKSHLPLPPKSRDQRTTTPPSLVSLHLLTDGHLAKLEFFKAPVLTHYSLPPCLVEDMSHKSQHSGTAQVKSRCESPFLETCSHTL